MATKEATLTSEDHPKTLIVGLYTQYNEISDQNRYYEEFLILLDTLKINYDGTHFTKLRHIDNPNFLTKGKRQELAEICEKEEYEQVIFSVVLSPLQERNLEDFLNCKIFDREKLILEIFKQSAQTSEGKIQVEMAEIEFLRTRLSGKGIELAQQIGGIGGKGPGETAKESIKRHLAERMRQAKKKLKTLQHSKDIQRKQRLLRKIDQLALVGYTNSGKSTILNQLTKSDVLVEDKLFATLDTTTRKLFLDGKNVLISDTIGFISELPHHLIEAFKSTLDELKFATLLLHVVDISNPMWRDQVKVVQETLKDIEVDKSILYIFNKIDQLEQKELETLKKDELNNFTPHVFISAKSKTGIKPLLEYLKSKKTFNVLENLNEN